MAARRTKGWRLRGDAMDVALDLGAKYGRPIVTGIGVAQDEQFRDPVKEDEGGWYIRVDFHSMEDGDSHVILRCKPDTVHVASRVRRITELNAAAFLRERERMQAGALAQQEADAREAEIVDIVRKLHEGEE